MLGMVISTCQPSYAGDINRKVQPEGRWEHETLLKITKAKRA
jgi:hypothetical protein